VAEGYRCECGKEFMIKDYDTGERGARWGAMGHRQQHLKRGEDLQIFAVSSDGELTPAQMGGGGKDGYAYPSGGFASGKEQKIPVDMIGLAVLHARSNYDGAYPVEKGYQHLGKIIDDFLGWCAWAFTYPWPAIQAYFNEHPDQWPYLPPAYYGMPKPKGGDNNAKSNSAGPGGNGRGTGRHDSGNSQKGEQSVGRGGGGEGIGGSGDRFREILGDQACFGSVFGPNDGPEGNRGTASGNHRTGQGNHREREQRKEQLDGFDWLNLSNEDVRTETGEEGGRDVSDDGEIIKPARGRDPGVEGEPRTEHGGSADALSDNAVIEPAYGDIGGSVYRTVETGRDERQAEEHSGGNEQRSPGIHRGGTKTKSTGKRRKGSDH